MCHVGDGHSKRRASVRVVILRLVSVRTHFWDNASGGGSIPKVDRSPECVHEFGLKITTSVD